MLCGNVFPWFAHSTMFLECEHNRSCERMCCAARLAPGSRVWPQVTWGNVL